MNKTRQWAILTVVAVLVVLGGGWMLLVSHQRTKAKSLDDEAAKAQSQVASLHTTLAELQAEKKNLPQQERVLAAITQKIPTDPAEPTLIRQLQGAAHTAGVDLTTLSPSAPTLVTPGTTPGAPSTAAAATSTTPVAGATATTLPLYQIPVAITVEGSYFNIEMFEHEVERLPRAMLVSGLTIVPATSTGGSATGSSTTTTSDDLAATLSADVFLSPTTTTPATAAAGSSTSQSTTAGTAGSPSTTN